MIEMVKKVIFMKGNWDPPRHHAPEHAVIRQPAHAQMVLEIQLSLT